MMRSLLVILACVAVVLAGFWAYRENYASKQALAEAAQLNREINRLRDAIAIQRAEWAYLNRPDRLAELVAANFDRLGLLPMLPDQFVRIEELSRPAPTLELGSIAETSAADDGEVIAP